MVKKSQDYNDESSSDSSNEKSHSTAVSRSCDHVKKAVDSAKLRKLLKATGLLLECTKCQTNSDILPPAETEANADALEAFECDNTLWLCLQCATQLCGRRSKHQHALNHFKVSR